MNQNATETTQQMNMKTMNQLHAHHHAKYYFRQKQNSQTEFFPGINETESTTPLIHNDNIQHASTYPCLKK